VSHGSSSDEDAQRGRERREAAEERAAVARERAEEATNAEEAVVHERAVRVHEDAADLQRRHEEEHADEADDEDGRGPDG
jgi:hypothetical protein